MKALLAFAAALCANLGGVRAWGVAPLRVGSRLAHRGGRSAGSTVGPLACSASPSPSPSDAEALQKLSADIDALLAASALAAPSPSAPEPQSRAEGWADAPLVKRGIALASSLAAAAFFFVQHNSADATGVALLRKMEAESVPLPTALCSGKPTVVEFFAPWCEACKESAPGMRALELQFRDRVNFVAIDGANAANSKLVSLFRVDGIPHLAFIGADTAVETSLVGAVPKQMVREDLVALLGQQGQGQGQQGGDGKGKAELPYLGFDAFEQSAEGAMLIPDKSICPASSPARGGLASR